MVTRMQDMKLHIVKIYYFLEIWTFHYLTWKRTAWDPEYIEASVFVLLLFCFFAIPAMKSKGL